MAKIPFNIDLKRLSQESLKSVEQLSKQFAAYEKRLKTLVHDIDVQTRDARKQGRDRLDRFLDELRSRRDVLEKRVTELVRTESKRIQEGVHELVTYLKMLRANGAASSGAPRSAKATKAAGSRRKTGGKKKASGAKKAAPAGGRSPRRKAPVDAASPPVM
jgi:SMC interacting uncharacterized protein involved in chromosome segregation